jgi:hypothetical protein
LDLSAVTSVVAAVDLRVTLHAHHAVGAVSSLGQVLGWTVFVVLVTALAVASGHWLQSRLHRRRIARSSTELPHGEAVVGPTTIPPPPGQRRWRQAKE